jgi:hypothetical protein
MKTIDETEDYEVGYGKPPKSGQFKKGVSGNPSGRPKKPMDGDAEWTQVFNSRVTIIENGKRKAIKGRLAYKKQMMKKAILGDPRASQTIMIAEQGVDLRAEEARQKVAQEKNLTVRDLTDEKLDELLAKALRDQSQIS